MSVERQYQRTTSHARKCGVVTALISTAVMVGCSSELPINTDEVMSDEAQTPAVMSTPVSDPTPELAPVPIEDLSSAKINPANAIGLYNQALAVINLEPIEPFIDLHRFFSNSSLDTPSENFTLKSIAVDDVIWDCVTSDCDASLVFDPGFLGFATLSYDCANGGTMINDYRKSSQDKQYDFQFNGCVYSDTMTLNGDSSYEITPNYQPSPPMEYHRFQNLTITLPNNGVVLLNGQMNWVANRDYYDYLAAYNDVGKIGGQEFIYQSSTAEGITDIYDLVIRRRIGRPIQSSTYEPWSSTLHTEFSFRSNFSNDELITVSILRDQQLSTSSASACFDTGVIQLYAEDGSRLQVLVNGVEDQITLNLHDNANQLVSSQVESWITSDRPVPPKQLKYAQGEAPVSEDDICKSYLLDWDRVGPIGDLNLTE